MLGQATIRHVGRHAVRCGTISEPRIVYCQRDSLRLFANGGYHGAGSMSHASGRGGWPVASIDWAFVCDLAYFDRHDRLCIVGITQKFVFPRLPVGLHQIMLVAHLVADSVVGADAGQSNRIRPT